MRVPPEEFQKIVTDYTLYSKLLNIRTKEIEDPDTGEKIPPKIIPFVFNSPQMQYHKFKMDLRKLGVPVRIIILKNRQSGFTTYEQGESYMWCSTKRYIEALTMAHTDASAIEIFTMVIRFHELMNPFFKADRKRESTTKIEFPKRGCKFTIATAGSAKIGVTLNKAHLSEGAYYESLNTTLGLLKDCVSSGSEIVIESTPNGYNDYHAIYDGAQDLYKPRPKSQITNGYYRFFTRWFDDPQYQFHYWEKNPIKTWDDLIRYTGTITAEEKLLIDTHKLSPMQICWRRWKIMDSLNNMDDFWEKYPEDDIQCFLTSGAQYFNLKEILAKMIAWSDANQPIITDASLGLKIWEKPHPDLRYCAGGDPAEGIEKDRSAFHMVEEKTGRTVMTFASDVLPPHAFAKYCADYCKMYNHAFLTIERNNHGHTVLNELIHHLDYYQPWQLYHHHGYFEDFKPLQSQLRKEFSGGYEPGFPTKSNTKAMLLDNQKQFIEEYPEAALDIDTIAEFKTFSRLKGGKLGAAPPNHDDRVIAHALALWGRYTDKGPDDYSRNYKTF